MPDLPLEESAGWEQDAAAEGVETVLLAAPVTPDERLAELCRRSRGFIYGVNLMGVTGERSSLAQSAGVLAKRLKAVTDKPVVMGFGISTPEQAVAAAESADGVVVASALMRLVLWAAGRPTWGEPWPPFVRLSIAADRLARTPVPSMAGPRPLGGRGPDSSAGGVPAPRRAASHPPR